MSTRTLPVREWYVRLERVHDEAEALEAWRHLVLAQGWSPVGEPWIVRDGTPAVVGRLVEHPGLTLAADVRQVVFPWASSSSAIGPGSRRPWCDDFLEWTRVRGE